MPVWALGDELVNDVDALAKIIKGEKWYDFYLVSYDGRSAVIKGTLDISYGYNLEVRLEDVRYIDAPVMWKTDTAAAEVVRIFKREDLDDRLRRRFFDQGGDWVLAFSAECFDSSQWVYFAAESFTITHKGMWDAWKWYESPNPPPVAGMR